MSKQTVNVIKIIPFFELKPNARYFFKRGNSISEGIAVFCDNCGKACYADSVTITSFNKKQINITIADISDDELSYCEDTDTCICSDCCP